jgi:hypothetical protein
MCVLFTSAGRKYFDLSKVILTGLSSAFFLQLSAALAGDLSSVNARYSWMLPKTIIEATINYEFVSCETSSLGGRPRLQLKITPTLLAKAIPDPKVGMRSIDPETLKSFWQNSLVEIKTFEGSHILKSMGSQPASAINAIFSNIVSGVATIVATNLGVPAVGVKSAGPGILAETIADIECGRAQNVRAKLEGLKRKIAQWQEESTIEDTEDKADQTATDGDRSPSDEPGRKPARSATGAGTGGGAEQKIKDKAALIKAAQDQINALQTKLTLTIRRSIDTAKLPIEGGNASGIGADGNVARILLYQSLDEILDNGWLRFTFATQGGETPSDSSDEKKAIEPNSCDATRALFKPTAKSGGAQSRPYALEYCIETKEQLAELLRTQKLKKEDFVKRHFTDPDPARDNALGRLRDSLTLNIYLEFRDSHPRITVCPRCRRRETFVGNDMQFRDAVYMPVSVYQGYKEKYVKNDENSRAKPLLESPPVMPFAQFGPARALPIFAAPFESLKWSVTFSESGELIAADFSSQSIGAQITQFFSTAAGARYAIAAEERAAAAAAANSETQRLNAANNALKAQIDNINYNNQLNALRAQGYAPH